MGRYRKQQIREDDPALIGWVYTLHIAPPFKHARHYTGFAQDKRTLRQRIADHQTGRGSRLCAVAVAAGHTLHVGHLRRGTRRTERYLKKCGHAADRCRICRLAAMPTEAKAA